MEITKTNRGFALIKFIDSLGENCSLQKSSSVIDKIWLGVTHPRLVVFENDQHGKYLSVDMPTNFTVNSRMELNQEQVAELIPYLQRFVETGCL